MYLQPSSGAKPFLNGLKEILSLYCLLTIAEPLESLKEVYFSTYILYCQQKILAISLVETIRAMSI